MIPLLVKPNNHIWCLYAQADAFLANEGFGETINLIPSWNYQGVDGFVVRFFYGCILFFFLFIFFGNDSKLIDFFSSMLLVKCFTTLMEQVLHTNVFVDFGRREILAQKRIPKEFFVYNIEFGGQLLVEGLHIDKGFPGSVPSGETI